jgi:glutamate N-acetyltransferase/amino-acid N-acetyltransferase
VSVTFPRGFRASGIAAGLKASGKPDLGLLVADPLASASGLLTTNVFEAAPVTVTRSHLARGRARAVVVNSGQANAGTGEPGVEDALATARTASGVLGCDPRDILVCSTGMIGRRIPMGTLLPALPVAAASLDGAGGPAFARAILTTDRRVKEATATAGRYRVGGCAKGAGMIGPRMAPARLGTLLAFLTTDAPADPGLLQRIASERVAAVWNGLTVDGCASTNDTVLLLASGAAGGPPLAWEDDAATELADAFEAVCRDLVRGLAADAEGASTVMVVQVDGAPDEEAARRVGLAVAGSPLVKTALFGRDANPGRILQAIGAAGVLFEPTAVRALLAGVPVVDRGLVPDPFPAEALAEAMKEPEVVIEVDLGGGPGSATVFGCDLTYEYVRINAEYTT